MKYAYFKIFGVISTILENFKIYSSLRIIYDIRKYVSTSLRQIFEEFIFVLVVVF